MRHIFLRYRIGRAPLVGRRILAASAVFSRAPAFGVGRIVSELRVRLGDNVRVLGFLVAHVFRVAGGVIAFSTRCRWVAYGAVTIS
jgi:hypothetical protein